MISKFTLLQLLLTSAVFAEFKRHDLPDLEGSIIDVVSGKIYKEGKEIAELLESSNSQTHQIDFAPPTPPTKWTLHSDDGCVVFVDTQKLCGTYNLPWRANGTARICPPNIPAPAHMPAVYAATQAILFSILTLLSVIGNIALMLGVMTSARVHGPIYWLLAGLSSSSLVLVTSQYLLLLPQTVAVKDSFVLGEFSCYFLHVMSAVATVASTLFILTIAFERYIVSRTGLGKPVFTSEMVRVAILLIWGLSGFYGCGWLPFVEYDSCYLINGQPIFRCSLLALDIWRAALSVCEGFFLLALPLAAAVILLVQTSPPPPILNRPIYNPTGQKTLTKPPAIRRIDRPYDLVRLMLCVLIAYILLAAPRRLMELYISSTTEGYDTHLVDTLVYSMMFLNAIVYPVLVVSLSPSMRRAVAEICRRKRKTFTREVATQKWANKARQLQRRERIHNDQTDPNTISFIHVSPSGQHLNRLSSSFSFTRSISTGSGGSNRNSSSESVTSNDDVFYSFPATRQFAKGASYA